MHDSRGSRLAAPRARWELVVDPPTGIVVELMTEPEPPTCRSHNLISGLAGHLPGRPKSRLRGRPEGVLGRCAVCGWATGGTALAPTASLPEPTCALCVPHLRAADPLQCRGDVLAVPTSPAGPGLCPMLSGQGQAGRRPPRPRAVGACPLCRQPAALGGGAGAPGVSSAGPITGCPISATASSSCPRGSAAAAGSAGPARSPPDPSWSAPVAPTGALRPAHCRRDRPPAACWPEGPVCESSYTEARRRRGTCARCHQQRQLGSCQSAQASDASAPTPSHGLRERVSHTVIDGLSP
jgi:hypothetical protein